MSDARKRELERQAASGDQQAWLALVALRKREGRLVEFGSYGALHDLETQDVLIPPDYVAVREAGECGYELRGVLPCRLQKGHEGGHWAAPGGWRQ